MPRSQADSLTGGFTTEVLGHAVSMGLPCRDYIPLSYFSASMMPRSAEAIEEESVCHRLADDIGAFTHDAQRAYIGLRKMLSAAS